MSINNTPVYLGSFPEIYQKMKEGERRRAGCCQALQLFRSSNSTLHSVTQRALGVYCVSGSMLDNLRISSGKIKHGFYSWEVELHFLFSVGEFIKLNSISIKLYLLKYLDRKQNLSQEFSVNLQQPMHEKMLLETRSHLFILT